MATQIVITNGDIINVDNGSQIILWADRGGSMPALPDTIHCILWNNLPGQNEIQDKDASTGMMTGNVNLNATSDVVTGTTTIADLLAWADTRLDQIGSANIDYSNELENAKAKWVEDGNSADDFVASNSSTNSYYDWTKTWQDFDPDKA